MLSTPDIRFRNAVDNDVELLGDPDACLMYDRPIGPEGMLCSGNRTACDVRYGGDLPETVASDSDLVFGLLELRGTSYGSRYA
jgi:hypothetical protein